MKAKAHVAEQAGTPSMYPKTQAELLIGRTTHKATYASEKHTTARSAPQSQPSAARWTND